MSRRTFSLSADSRRGALYYAALMLLIAGYLVSRVMRETLPERWLLLVLILGGLAARTIWLNLMTVPLNVTVTGDAIGVADRVMGWGEIEELRVVPGGIAILRGGERVGFVSYEVNRFGELLHELTAKVRRHDVSMPARLTARSVWLDAAVRPVAVVLSGGYALWSYSRGLPLVAAVMGIVAGGMLSTIARLPVLSIDFAPEAMRVSRLIGTRVYPRGDVHGFAVIPAKWHVYAVAFVGERRRQVRLELKGVDPFYIFEAARRAYPEAAA